VNVAKGKTDNLVNISQAPDGFYLASCPLVPEARAQGKTYKICISNFKEALSLCLEFRRERGEEIPPRIEAENAQ
jgi:predicted RNase H-like HicB family nuclease